MVRLVAGSIVLGASCLGRLPAEAHLPHQIGSKGVVLATDKDTRCLVFKSGKTKKPFVLDWNNETLFVNDGKFAKPTDLKDGEAVEIHYQDVSFRNPMLKKVNWSGRGEKP
jgi:hypothetical protein